MLLGEIIIRFESQVSEILTCNKLSQAINELDKYYSSIRDFKRHEILQGIGAGSILYKV